MTLLIGWEILLDGLLLATLSYAIMSEQKSRKLRDGVFTLCFVFICALNRISVLPGTPAFPFSWSIPGYEIVPAEGIYLLLFMVLLVLILNSFWFAKPDSFTLFATLAVYAIFIIVRLLVVLLFYGLGTPDNLYNPLFCRIASLLSVTFLCFTPFFKGLQRKLNNGSLLVKILIGNTFGFLSALLTFLEFNLTKTTDNLIIVFLIICGLLLIDAFIIIYEQKRAAELERFQMMQQYIPVIEELISQVRSRQHEFNNRLLAISTAVATASSLKQAKQEIMDLSRGLQFSITESSLLSCHSKIVAGLIFSKTKFAAMKNITIVSEINAPLLSCRVPEVSLVEIIGILLDNAIEASQPNDTIYFNALPTNDGLSLLVSNPFPEQTLSAFARMFQRGFSTKAINNSRGYGLANVKEIVKRYNGKIITQNQSKQQTNYVTIGVLFD